MEKQNKSYQIQKVTNKSNYRRIFQELKKIDGVVNANINKEQNTLHLVYEGDAASIYNKVLKAFQKYERNTILVEQEAKEVYRKVLKLKGVDCAQCCTKIENLAKKNLNHEQIIVDFPTERFIIETTDPLVMDGIVEKVANIAHKVDHRIVVMDVATRKRVAAEEKFIISLKDIFLFIMGVAMLLVSYLVMYAVDGKYPWQDHDLSVLVTILTIVSYLLVGNKVIYRFFRNIFDGRFLDENFLMTVASIGAIATGHNFEAIFVMLLYQIGTFLQEKAVNHSRRSISELLSFDASSARVKVNGEVLEVEVESILPGDTVIVKNGEMIPVDGIITEGKTYLDTKALTGESMPSNVKVGDEVLSGSINMGSVIEIRVTRPHSESTMSKILDIVENASISKAKSENFITKFARWYTPVVVICAFVIASLSPVFQKLILSSTTSWHDLYLGGTVNGSIYTSMIFLVISCPCALVISIPLTFFGGIGLASKRGILIKGSNYLEALNNIENVIFDKTGTLTKGEFGVIQITPIDPATSQEELLRLAAYTEYHSTHPIGMSVVAAYGREQIFPEIIDEFVEIPSRGVKATINGAQITVGNLRNMNENKIKVPNVDTTGLVLHIMKDRNYMGYLIIGDRIREEAAPTIDFLRMHGVKKIGIFTGDSKNVSENVANSLGVDFVYSELLPAQKVEKLVEIKDNTLSKQGKTIYVGDGINDAPVISVSDVGIAMGGSGSEGAIAIADVVIMTDNLEKITEAATIAKATRKIVVQNIILALSVKFVVLILTIANINLSIWLAIFSDVGISLIAIINALRVTNVYRNKKNQDNIDMEEIRAKQEEEHEE